VTKRIKVTTPRTRAVRSTSRTARRIEPKFVADRLEAERTGLELGLTSAPHALLSLRRTLLAALRSSGGRPGLKGAARRQKIPMMDADWRELEKIAQSLQASGLNATAGQVAGQLLHDAITGLKTSPLPFPMPPPPAIMRVSEISAVAARKADPTESPRGVTYIVGAGINRGILGPENRQLPLSRDFFQYVLEQPKFANDTRLQLLWDFISRHWHMGQDALRMAEFDLEECFTLVELQREEALLSKDGDKLKATSRIEFLLSGLLIECFSGVDYWHCFSNQYQALGRRIFEEKAAVLTFNYDTLLEEAIAHASPALPDARGAIWVRFPERGVDIRDDKYAPRSWERLIAYKVHFDEVVVKPGSAHPELGVEYYARYAAAPPHPPFLKLHGSVDWHYRSGYAIDGKRIHPHDTVGGSRYGRTHAGLSRPELDTNTLEILLPLITTPVLNKRVREYPLLGNIWDRALEVLQKTRTLVVAGYSFPSTDPHVRRLLREAFADNTLEHLCVVNPDTSVVSIVRDLCNFRKPVLVSRDVGDFLSALPA
jgi:hypothetical protein